MDALQLLREVSSAYDAIETLSLEAEIVAESGDEFSNSISRHRLRFHYARPNRMRCEPLGRNGILVIANGAEVQFRFEPQGQISTHPLHQLPHSFQPDRPLTGNDEPFLFTSIHQQVDSAEYLRDENGCHVVSVRYWGAHMADARRQRPRRVLDSLVGSRRHAPVRQPRPPHAHR